MIEVIGVKRGKYEDRYKSDYYFLRIDNSIVILCLRFRNSDYNGNPIPEELYSNYIYNIGSCLRKSDLNLLDAFINRRLENFCLDECSLSISKVLKRTDIKKVYNEYITHRDF